MFTTLQGSKVPIRMWADPAEVDSAALDQLRNIANLPWVLGNPAAFTSASHGAGRRMSRTKARKTFGEEDLAAQTEGWSAARIPVSSMRFPPRTRTSTRSSRPSGTSSRSSHTSSRSCVKG